MVPNNDPSFNVHGFLYREDLRKKYGVPEPERFEDMAAYFDAILENEPGMIPFNEGNQSLPSVSYYLETRNELRLSPFVGSVEYDVNNPTPEGLESRWFSDVYREHYRLAKEWADAGYWSSDVLSNNINAQEAFEQGTSGSDIINLVGFNALYREMLEAHPDWELGWLDFTEGTAKAQNAGYTGDGMSLNWATENPARSLMLLEKLHLDEEYAMLTYYGIEGEHYVMEDGTVSLPAGVEDTGFPWDSFGWAWNETQFVMPSANDWPELADRLAEYENRQYFHPLPGFTVDQSDIAAELAAIQQVEQQYGYPLNWGVVDDVDEAEALLFEKLREAGIERVLEVQRQQLAEWQQQNQ
jgi:putative aldouronate transport system substrate-binding protein